MMMMIPRLSLAVVAVALLAPFDSSVVRCHFLGAHNSNSTATARLRRPYTPLSPVLPLTPTKGLDSFASATATAASLAPLSTAYPDCPPAPANLQWEKPLNDAHGQSLNDALLKVVTKLGSIFAVVYYENTEDEDSPLHDESHALYTLEWADKARCECLEMGLRDPYATTEGYLVPIYAFETDENPFGLSGNGVGTENYGIFDGVDGGVPFIASTLQWFAEGTTVHEVNHIMTHYHQNTPGDGFSYNGVSQWYSEAFAGWLSATMVPPMVDIRDWPFSLSQTIADFPHWPLWLTYDNGPFVPSGDDRWEVWNRQYGMAALLFYLTEVGGVSPSDLALPYAKSVDADDWEPPPQKWLAKDVLGTKTFAKLFADFAAANTAGFGYLDDAWVEQMIDQSVYNRESDPERTVAELAANGTKGKFKKPPNGRRPYGWAYNVIRMNLDNNNNNSKNNNGKGGVGQSASSSTKYEFRLKGNKKGVEGTKAEFQARIVIENKNGETRTIKAKRCGGKKTTTCAKATFSTADDDDAKVSFVVVSTPTKDFGDKHPNQQYGYKYKVKRK